MDQRSKTTSHYKRYSKTVHHGEQKPHLITNGTRIQCNTENFVPIVVRGLSASSTSSFPSSTSMTSSKQETDHPTSSSSSSTSPTMTVSSDSETRARADMCGTDSDPASVSSSHVERKERGDPLTKPTKNPKPNKNEITRKNGATRRVPTYQNGCKNSEKIAWMIEFLNAETRMPVLLMIFFFFEPTPTRSVDLVNAVFVLTSRKTDIARSVRGPT